MLDLASPLEPFPGDLPELLEWKRGTSLVFRGRSSDVPRISQGGFVMLLGILSDTHDQVERTRSAVNMLISEGATALIHCGDLTGPEVVHEFSRAPSYFVFGNCDYDREAIRQAIALIGGTCLDCGGLISLGGVRIAVTHGDSSSELKRLAALDPDYLFTGHTHHVSDIQKGPTRWVNPGALHRAQTWTVALLDTACNLLRVLPVINAKLHQ
jgi:uncharacterized protein